MKVKFCNKNKKISSLEKARLLKYGCQGNIKFREQ